MIQNLNSPSSTEIILTVEEKDLNLRLDQFLAQNLNLPRQKIKNLFEKNLIKNGSILNSKQNLKLSQKIFLNESFVVKILPEKNNNIINNPKNFLIKDFIVYEDKNIIVINKPAGLLSQRKPGESNEINVAELIKEYLGNISVGQKDREFIVHRLDKETSGLMVLAKNQHSYDFLIDQFKERKIDKKYMGFCWGIPNPTCNSIKKNLIRDKNHRTKMHVSIKKNEGKEAITHYRVKEILFDQSISLVEFILETGRTHQIRAHMNFINCGIIGDKLYGNTKNHSFSENFTEVKNKIKNIERHMLHSYHLSLNDPNNADERLNFEIDLPDDMLDVFKF